MAEIGFSCDTPYEGCCLSLHETILILVALTVAVQLALKLACVLFYYLWYLAGVTFGMLIVQEKPTLTSSKANKKYTLKNKPSVEWSYVDVPRRPRQKESRSPSHRCLHCTLEPVKVTMNLQNEGAAYRARRGAYLDYPLHRPSRYHDYDYESKPRPRRASAPSRYRYRDATSDSPDPILRPSRSSTPERRRAATGTEMVPRQRAGQTHHRAVRPGPEAEHTGTTPRSRRPAKVYIYPVNPQTPPGSRSTSPERSRRRRRHAITTSQEEQSEPERRALRRKAREASRKAEQTSTPMTLHYQGGSTNTGRRQAEPETPTGKPRYYWTDQVSGADWVYRQVK